jgi:hypothetical protein
MLIALSEAQKHELFDSWFADDEDLRSFDFEEFGGRWRDRGWLAEQDVRIETTPWMSLPGHDLRWPAIFVNGIECTAINSDTYRREYIELISMG